ncbi:chorismate-binding protein [Pelomonas sp. CA6]|uniref:chorismate-binding protein n=1 Tax=Pelomonas sp. CA6 TaxID=2907999 RepID=UPI001F4BD111|nr:chorismate-binding protein [Pelomonas sp. CA6]MCH7345057.1 chorismate-binding protein [Pelomonas sp. CA6]
MPAAVQSDRGPDRIQAAFDFPRHPLAREDGERLRGCFRSAPAEQLVAYTPDELRDVLRRAHARAVGGAWVLGGLRYEAAPALDPVLATQAPQPGRALARFQVWHGAPEPWPEVAEAQTLDLQPWVDSQTAADEAAQIERIRDYIRAGDCYQINLTTRLRAQAGARFSLQSLFFALHAAQPGGFALMMREPGGPQDAGGALTEAGVASVSPELFFDWRPAPDAVAGSAALGPLWQLAAQPMKGTAPRGADAASDEAAQAHLRTSAKERAENLMIVDLLRNDLARLAVTGTVRVPRLFELHALSTVWQMTSTITALSRPGLQLDEVMAALFPCGSVTGAPKRRAMQLIAALEPAARGWYCGALGLMQPGGAVTFNVPIRTVECGAAEQGGAPLVCGIGSGITLDSQPTAELEEWHAKTRFLLRAQAPVQALETLRLQDGVFAREARHRARMRRCAAHFGLAWCEDAWRATLADVAAAHPRGLWRVRLTLARDGLLQREVQPLQDWAAPVALALAARPLDTQGPGAEFLGHKTTRRELYQQMLADKPAEAVDLLLFNRDGELTEGCISNLALELDGQWLTPRQQAGLLPGVMREQLLAEGRVREARLTLADLPRATGLAIFNSVRGWCAARLLPGHGPDAPTPQDPSRDRTPAGPPSF